MAKKATPKPRSLSGWQKMRAGSKGRQQMPKSVFLRPGSRTYPVKTYNARTKRWSYSPRMIRAAISRANSQGNRAVSRDASALLKRVRKK